MVKLVDLYSRHIIQYPCSPRTTYRDISAFLSDKKTQQRLGVDPAKQGNFSYHSLAVSQAFRKNIDLWGFPAQHYISALLERGIRVLIYVGATDYICNWVGFPLEAILAKAKGH